jgi:hypothetical protein
LSGQSSPALLGNTLMVAATLLAALAAVASAFAAFRQEKASFTSQLYSKQVDVLADVLETQDQLALNRYSTNIPSEIIADVFAHHRVLTDPDLIQRMERMSQSALERDGRLRLSLKRLSLISPPSLRALVESIGKSVSEYDDSISQQRDLLTIQPALYLICESGRVDFKQCLGAELSRAGQTRARLYPSIVAGLNTIEYCSYREISRGEILTEGYMRRCLAKAKPPSSVAIGEG